MCGPLHLLHAAVLFGDQFVGLQDLEYCLRSHCLDGMPGQGGIAATVVQQELRLLVNVCVCVTDGWWNSCCRRPASFESGGTLTSAYVFGVTRLSRCVCLMYIKSRHCHVGVQCIACQSNISHFAQCRCFFVLFLTCMPYLHPAFACRLQRAIVSLLATFPDTGQLAADCLGTAAS